MSVAWFDSKRSMRGPDVLHRRRHPRKPVNRPALILADGKMRPCTVLDVSEGGARIRLDHVDELPDTFELVLAWGARMKRICQVRWRSACEIGVQFRQV